MTDTDSLTYATAGGIAVERRSREAGAHETIPALRRALDEHRGAVFSSNYEVPGRYRRWDFGFVNPPLVLTARGRHCECTALNQRGRVLLPVIRAALAACPHVRTVRDTEDGFAVDVAPLTGEFTEEERPRQPTAFSVVRALVDLFRSEADRHLGLYGAFGYDLTFQFDPIRLRHERPADLRDMVLYIPDELLVVDHYLARSTVYSFDFAALGNATHGLARSGARTPFRPAERIGETRSHPPGTYADVVRQALPYFARGDLFETVPSQTFYEPCRKLPSQLAADLSTINPSPYGFMIALGEGEHLVGASPEMFVRVTGRRIETCPIAGTIRRGADALGDAEQIRTLLNSAKDEAELTMCSDVDRNDKSRVCEPGSVQVIGRRQIEMYSRLIHTVDHIEGRLRPDRDALDGFLSHTWAVTVTGAPKHAAIQFIEDHEAGPRAWYGGAIGVVNFNGDMNTGLTLRTVRIQNGVAEVRVGATLLYDSEPEEEERETELKASAMLAALRSAPAAAQEARPAPDRRDAREARVLLVDHQDSFVHTLAGYFRTAGADVTTVRSDVALAFMNRIEPDLVVLSPGPGRPDDFGLRQTIAAARRHGIAVFGVCLGLQGIVEAFGGELDQLPTPVHGKASPVLLSQCALFEGLPDRIVVGRYHSLVARPSTVPDALRVTARTEDGVVMAVEHRDEPIGAVQFHPESILSLSGEAGMRIVENALASAIARGARRPVRLSA